MADALFVVVCSWLTGEEGGELLVEVNKLLRILATLELVLSVSQSSDPEQAYEPLTVVSRDKSAQPRKTCVNFQAAQ